MGSAIKKELCQDPVLQVVTSNGIIQGKPLNTASNKTYYAFQGIPFAEPPTGPLRFKAPKEHGDWSGVLDATNESISCISVEAKADLTVKALGGEDCLFLNVYIPQLPKKLKKLLPVMFWIHGGAFIGGPSQHYFYNPMYFMEHGVIVVTANYRLGTLGFLSTGDNQSTGNYGLKDQHMALKWVNRNIRKFGGDPNSVTIFGQSAGAASVHLQMQYSKNKNLFQRAIIQSGSSLCSWTNQRKPLDVAYLVAMANGIIPQNTKELVARLKNVNEDTIRVNQVVPILLKILTVLTDGLPFAPTLEPAGQDAFLSRNSYEMLRNGDFHKVPVMIGFNSLEILLFESALRLLRIFIDVVGNDPLIFIPPAMNINPNAEPVADIANKIKEMYFGGKELRDVPLEKIIEFASDTAFLRPIANAAKLMANYTSVYFYEFTYQGKAGMEGVYEKPHGRQIPGVAHAEELFYLWHKDGLFFKNKMDALISRRLLKLWTNFAKFGDPTPKREKLLEKVKWPKVSPQGLVNITYLEISDRLTVKNNLRIKQLQFWDNLFRMYAHPPFHIY